MPKTSTVLLKILSALPEPVRHSLRRRWHFFQAKRPPQPGVRRELDLLLRGISEGDWVIDVGANVGEFTLEMSRRVGPNGRVIAVEPVLDSFDILCMLARRLPHNNITLLNVAGSDCGRLVSMHIPNFPDGRRNFYQAQIVDSGDSQGLSVLAIPLASIPAPHSIRLIKIDAEGHDDAVMKGLVPIIQRDRPDLIVETCNEQMEKLLKSLDYALPGEIVGANILFKNGSLMD